MAIMLALLSGCGGTGAEQVKEPASPGTGPDGKVYIPAIDLPVSSLLSAETQVALKQRREVLMKEAGAATQSCGSLMDAAEGDIPRIRQCMAETFYTTTWYKSLTDRYAFSVRSETVGGVPVEIFTPAGGVAPENNNRVLINLHGGGFLGGGRTNSHLESAPIAALGKIKVVSIDYRMAPEYGFPAASEDVAAVYREILKDYEPSHIGIYGCSAGGLLTAQSLAWFQHSSLPMPGAVGMFCGAAIQSNAGGDMSKLGWFMMGFDIEAYRKTVKKDYFDGTDLNDPLVSPGVSDTVMAKFPASLLISSTRDAALSTVVVTHRQLLRLGVEADLHVWEGMDHAFLYDPNIPESRDAYQTTVNFFERHLAR